jgi:hypothetical protein
VEGSRTRVLPPPPVAPPEPGGPRKPRHQNHFPPRRGIVDPLAGGNGAGGSRTRTQKSPGQRSVQALPSPQHPPPWHRGFPDEKLHQEPKDTGEGSRASRTFVPAPVPLPPRESCPRVGVEGTTPSARRRRCDGQGKCATAETPHRAWMASGQQGWLRQHGVQGEGGGE